MNDLLMAAIDAREKGAIPVSIGTSLAVEAASGIFPDRPENPAPLTRVREMWFNVRTLLRNILGSVPTETKEQLLPVHLLTALLEDMRILETAVVKASNGMSRAVFYHCDYTTLRRKFPKANLKEPSTPKQQFQHALEERTLQELLRSQDLVDIRTYRYELTGQHPEAFIVTHLPVDLLSRYSFKKLELTESYTGAIKAFPQWHSKLTGGKELVNIPFNAFSLQVFGDNGNLFTPLLPSLRKEVLRLAQEDRWVAITTDEKIRMSLRKVADPTSRAILMSLL